MSYLAQAASRVRRALRQEQRLQAAHAAYAQEQERIGFESGFLPESLQEQDRQFEDELYFLVIAARQAVAAHGVVTAEGVDLPPIRNHQSIVDWRDVLEHWDDPPLKGKEIRALKRWSDTNNDPEPGRGYSTRADTREVLDISGVSLAWLRTDLAQVLDAVEQTLSARFEEEWLDPERAAAYLGLAAIPDPSPYPGIICVEWPEKGRRFQREGLDRWRAFRRAAQRRTP